VVDGVGGCREDVMEIVYERVAGIDVHKRQITVTVRTPDTRPGKRREQVRRYATFYSALREMTSWLIGEAVTHVAMESTGVYWKPVFHALAEPGGLEIVLCNAAHVKNVPGRKTDVKDSPVAGPVVRGGTAAGQFHPSCFALFAILMEGSRGDTPVNGCAVVAVNRGSIDGA
jgi:hypothetical protein